MATIHHRVSVRAPLGEVFRAIVRDPYLSGGWSGGSMSVVELSQDARLSLRCADGPREWIGTEVTFSLSAEGEHTAVRLVHRGFREASDAMAESATAWARLLLAMKRRMEIPEPDDVFV